MTFVKDWKEKRGFNREQDDYCTYNATLFLLSVFPHRAAMAVVGEHCGLCCSPQMA